MRNTEAPEIDGTTYIEVLTSQRNAAMDQAAAQIAILTSKLNVAVEKLLAAADRIEELEARVAEQEPN